jgi:hypothetical protein
MGAIVPVMSLALTAVGTGISAIGAEKQASAEASAANYNAQVARNAATFATQQGQVQAEAEQRKTAGLIGRERAIAGASGVDVNSGSPLDIQADTYSFGQQNVGTALNNASRQAWGYSEQAGLDTFQAGADQQAGNWTAFGDLVGGAASGFGKFSQFQQSGAFDPNTINMFGADSSYPWGENR